MPFQPGHKLATGRPPGSPNKNHDELRKAFENKGINLIDMFLSTWAELQGQRKGPDGKTITDLSKNNPEKRIDAVLRVMEFIYPKQRHIDVEITPYQAAEVLRGEVERLRLLRGGSEPVGDGDGDKSV